MRNNGVPLSPLSPSPLLLPPSPLPLSPYLSLPLTPLSLALSLPHPSSPPLPPSPLPLSQPLFCYVYLIIVIHVAVFIAVIPRMPAALWPVWKPLSVDPQLTVLGLGHSLLNSSPPFSPSYESPGTVAIYYRTYAKNEGTTRGWGQSLWFAGLLSASLVWLADAGN